MHPEDKNIVSKLDALLYDDGQGINLSKEQAENLNSYVQETGLESKEALEAMIDRGLSTLWLELELSKKGLL